MKLVKFTLAATGEDTWVNPESVCQVSPYLVGVGNLRTGITMSDGYTIPVAEPVITVVRLLERGDEEA